MGVRGNERSGIEGRVRERARARLEWDDVWDGTVVPAKVVRGPTVSARRSKTRRTGCHRAGLSSFSARRSSFCEAPRGVIYRERSFIPAYFRARTLGEGAIATKNDRPSPVASANFKIYRGHLHRYYRVRKYYYVCRRISLIYRVYD